MLLKASKVSWGWGVCGVCVRELHSGFLLKAYIHKFEIIKSEPYRVGMLHTLNYLCFFTSVVFPGTGKWVNQTDSSSIGQACAQVTFLTTL